MSLLFIGLHLQSRFLFICDDNLHIYTQKKSPARATDFPNYIGERYSIKAILEAALCFLQDRRHASLDVAADRAPLLHRIAMNRECREELHWRDKCPKALFA